MRYRLDVQEVTRAPDGQGGFTETWATTTTIWANITPLKAYEKFQAMQMQSPVTHKVLVRYNSMITTQSRLIFGDRIFEIKELINQNEANVFLQMLCVENFTVSQANYRITAESNSRITADGNIRAIAS